MRSHKAVPWEPRGRGGEIVAARLETTDKRGFSGDFAIFIPHGFGRKCLNWNGALVLVELNCRRGPSRPHSRKLLTSPRPQSFNQNKNLRGRTLPPRAA